jgi:hypothetical protein
VWGLTLLFVAGVVIGRFWDHLRAFLRRGLPLIEGRAYRRPW